MDCRQRGDLECVAAVAGPLQRKDKYQGRVRGPGPDTCPSYGPCERSFYEPTSTGTPTSDLYSVHDPS